MQFTPSCQSNYRYFIVSIAPPFLWHRQSPPQAAGVVVHHAQRRLYAGTEQLRRGQTQMYRHRASPHSRDPHWKCRETAMRLGKAAQGHCPPAGEPPFTSGHRFCYGRLEHHGAQRAPGAAGGAEPSRAGPAPSTHREKPRERAGRKVQEQPGKGAALCEEWAKLCGRGRGARGFKACRGRLSPFNAFALFMEKVMQTVLARFYIN